MSQIAYTLAEVMIATALLAIVGVALYGGMSSGFAITQASRENLRATQILVERMEGIRLYNWNQLVYSNWIPQRFTNWYYPLTKPGESPGIMYLGEMHFQPNPTLNPTVTYGPYMCEVSATVNWTSGGVPRSRTLTTYAARDGVQNYVYTSTNYLAP
ncbi:MAG TPA: hypothetical protein VJA21_32845 [Verrucomicrobiae bacterium]